MTKRTPRITLTEAQHSAISKHLDAFAKYASTAQFQTDQQERLDHVSFFQKELPGKVSELSESDLQSLVGMLWASKFWGNWRYHAQKVISDNGLDKLRRELARLLDVRSPVGARYERFMGEIRGLGPASVTEMLCYTQPDDCGIWNEKARQAFRILGLRKHVDPGKYRLSGDEYVVFNNVLRTICAELGTTEFEDANLLLVDFFLYEVARGSAVRKHRRARLEDIDHDRIRDMIMNIGEMLGFDADTEVPIAPGTRVDAVWRAQIANLGRVTYVFEVHKSGSIANLLLNLQKAKHNPTVQKVIAVTDETQIEKIKRKSEGLRDEFEDYLKFWPAADVEKVNDNLRTAIQAITSLDLLSRMS